MFQCFVGKHMCEAVILISLFYFLLISTVWKTSATPVVLLQCSEDVTEGETG